MKAAVRHSLLRILMGCAAVGLSHSAFAQLHITGTVPVGAAGSNGGIVIVIPSTQLANHTNYTVSGLLKFKFRAPTPASVTALHIPWVFALARRPIPVDWPPLLSSPLTEEDRARSR